MNTKNAFMRNTPQNHLDRIAFLCVQSNYFCMGSLPSFMTKLFRSTCAFFSDLLSNHKPFFLKVFVLSVMSTCVLSAATRSYLIAEIRWHFYFCKTQQFVYLVKLVPCFHKSVTFKSMSSQNVRQCILLFFYYF